MQESASRVNTQFSNLYSGTRIQAMSMQTILIIVVLVLLRWRRLLLETLAPPAASGK